MRGIMVGITAGLMVLASSSDLEAQATAFKFGYIDSQAILQEAPGAPEAQAEFERQMEAFTTEIEQMGTRLDSLVAAYQQQQSTLLPNVRQGREAEITQLQQRYQQRVDQMGQDAETSRQALIEPILTQMAETIEAVREEGGYHVIMDVASQAIVAADTSQDLTEEVLRRMREAAGAEGSQ
jgi:outer membrane protein